MRGRGRDEGADMGSRRHIADQGQITTDVIGPFNAPYAISTVGFAGGVLLCECAPSGPVYAPAVGSLGLAPTVVGQGSCFRCDVWRSRAVQLVHRPQPVPAGESMDPTRHPHLSLTGRIAMCVMAEA